MNPALTVSAPSRRQLVVAAILALLAAATVALLLTLKLSDLWFLPPCQFHRLTGLHCPGCGLTRATWHLFHGHVLTALHCNALFTIALVGLAGVGVWRWIAPAQRQPAWKPFHTWLLLVMCVVFAIARNIPAYPFTLLAP